MPQNNDVTYKLSAYEGPIALLYQLIKNKKVDICDIPVSEMADQYIGFLEKAEDRDMDSMSEFTVFAATLLEIKSRMLLPALNAQDEPNPAIELIDRIELYRKAKEMAASLSAREYQSGEFYFKNPDKDFIDSLKAAEKSRLTIDDALSDISVLGLYDIFKNVISRKELKTDKIRSSFKSVKKDMFTVAQKTFHIKGLLEISESVSFIYLIEACVSKEEAVVTFLALLEMVKTREVQVAQTGLFKDIIIRRVVRREQ